MPDVSDLLLRAQVRQRLGFTPASTEERFETDGWSYEGSCRSVPCSSCAETPLEIWRRPYRTTTGQYKHWGIVCPNCQTLVDSQGLEPKSIRALRKWSERVSEKAPAKKAPADLPIRLISWNINRQKNAWKFLADSDADVALLQEASAPPEGLDLEVISGGEWFTAGYKKRKFSTAVVRCSQRLDVSPEPKAVALQDAVKGQVALSRPGSLQLATIRSDSLAAPIIVVSAYSVWEDSVDTTESAWLYADASAHRLISDLSVLFTHEREHRIIVVGDWNVLHGYSENGSTYWEARYRTVFDRMEAIGLRFVGPQQPNGLPAIDPAEELPKESLDVPTYRSKKKNPESARRQMDFAFASETIADSLTVWALNGVDEWGPSDHCRILVEINET